MLTKTAGPFTALRQRYDLSWVQGHCHPSRNRSWSLLTGTCCFFPLQYASWVSASGSAQHDFTPAHKPRWAPMSWNSAHASFMGFFSISSDKTSTFFFWKPESMLFMYICPQIAWGQQSLCVRWGTEQEEEQRKNLRSVGGWPPRPWRWDGLCTGCRAPCSGRRRLRSCR